MIEAGIGRGLVAGLHQAIAELLPTRLEFYEAWISPEGMREGRVTRAPLTAVISFLRQEGEAYDAVMARAGELAAGWWLATVNPVRRTAAGTGPLWVRGRLAMGLCADFITATVRATGVTSAWVAGQGELTLSHSLFCEVREPAGHALCGFYTAGVAAVLAAVRCPGTVRTASCRGTGDTSCVLRVEPPS